MHSNAEVDIAMPCVQGRREGSGVRGKLRAQGLKMMTGMPSTLRPRISTPSFICLKNFSIPPLLLVPPSPLNKYSIF